MRALQKLVRNGNSTAIAIPRPILIRLGWLPGRSVVVELTESCDALVVRVPCDRDFGLAAPPRILEGGAEAKA